MGEIVSSIFSSFSNVISGLAGGIQNAFSHILWKGVEGTDGVVSYVSANGLSDLAQFGLIFLGVSLAIGLVYGAVRLISRKKA